jgi:hypothetical protein
MKGYDVRHSLSKKPRSRWASAALVPMAIGKPFLALALAGAVGLPVLVLVLVVAVIALGAAFGRSTQRRQACLRTLQTLLKLAAWVDRRDGTGRRPSN